MAEATTFKSLENVKNIVMVLSGKGGVGKSSVSVQVALSLVQKGYKVGILDIDLCGPSIPRMLGIQDKQIHQSSNGWVPVYVGNEKNFSVMSVGFLLENQDDAVVWRGPKKSAMIKQFLEDVCWGELDYLVIDTPPGTSDEHISIVEYLSNLSPIAVLVTTPQNVAISDVKKELNFCRKVNVPISGIIENMSGYVCPHCSDCTPIFSSGGGEKLANEYGIKFLGKVPIDPKFIEAMEKTDTFVETYKDLSLAKIFSEIVDEIISTKN
ncbi:P-loop containing nucleoside triphosphate hydrolase protein [Neocallimastix californiae]|jgi:Mrp family chromosome partitioning ATPase|uniref:p-loop containing nucleoside triphosphate hydrolase protein n=1 Tax=Neocallimastix californiae TaxID=1754190 RepID=A0A1Y2ALB9_9FUNG|nr:P-loop containing nucleoside triphosphate hydrolase protein [Neocallimastix californiae]|eukprot:ORY23306.1 P-loop containing nucleoside triphosphate hydrolase protein [Neocallimastix californiae]